MPDGPTIYDIAKRAGVGIATVSRTLNGSPKVADATREAVLRAVAETGFRPNRAARRLATGTPPRPRIAGVMPLAENDFPATVARSLIRGVAATGMDLALHDAGDAAERRRILDRLLDERSCDALVLCSVGMDADQLERLRERRIPTLLVDFDLPGMLTGTVDNHQGGLLAARHLHERGCRRPALLDGPSDSPAFSDRRASFRAVFGAEAPAWASATVTREAGRQAVAALLERDPGIDGLVCVTDIYAVGALEELAARGIRVPDEMQVIGFDDLPLMDVIGLSTVRQPMAEMGAWAAETITALVSDPGVQAGPRVFPLALVPRRTTR